MWIFLNHGVFKGCYYGFPYYRILAKKASLMIMGGDESAILFLSQTQNTK